MPAIRMKPEEYEELIAGASPEVKEKAPKLEKPKKGESLFEALGKLGETYLEERKARKEKEELREVLKAVRRPLRGKKEPRGTREESLAEFYIPRMPVRRDKMILAGEALVPGMTSFGRLMQPELGAMRELTMLKPAEQAVYREIHANGDHDVKSHIISEVKQEGFSSKEITDALRRLRELGYIRKSGKMWEGEPEYEI